MNAEAGGKATLEAVLRDKDGNIKQVWATPEGDETPGQARERVIAENPLPTEETD